MSSSWSDDLPGDILLLIVKKVIHGCDFLSFSHVCSSWRSIAKQERKRFRPEIPGFLTEQRSNSDSDAFIRFQSLSKLKRRPELFLPGNSAVYGSHQGWIVIEDPKRYHELVLINPVTQVRFKLPFHFYSRIIFSANPTDYHNCYYIIVNSWSGLRCCKLGDVRWTDVEFFGDEYSSSGFMDAIYYRGKLYAVRITGELFVCDDITASPPMMTKLVNNPRYSPVASAPDLHSLIYESPVRFFLVETGQELLLVYCRGKYLSSSSKSEAMEVYRLDLGGLRWDRVRNLGEHVLFLGESQSFSLSESDVRGIKGNHIFYMEESKNLRRRESSWESEGEKDSEEDSEKEISVFSLEKSRAGRLTTTKSPWEREKSIGFWFMPQFFC